MPSATFGARLAAGLANAQSVGFVLVTGNDFPNHVLDRFRSWRCTPYHFALTDSTSTRGVMEYDISLPVGKSADLHQRAGKTWLLNEPLSPCAQILHTAGPIASPAFHTLATPELLEKSCLQDMLSARCCLGIQHKPIIVWEPDPTRCKRQHLEEHVNACAWVDVFSPTHTELVALCTPGDQEVSPNDQQPSIQLIEDYARRFLKASMKNAVEDATVIAVRAGKHGCLVMSVKHGKRWFPAFYENGSKKIVDVDGAGSAFLGAFTYVLQTTGSMTEAAIYGIVAASFAMEQIGLPVLSSEEDADRWNEEDVVRRLDAYRWTNYHKKWSPWENVQHVSGAS